MDLNKPLLIRPETLHTLAASMGGHFDRGSRYVDREIQISNGVALVDVDGVLMERADSFDAWWLEGLSVAALTEKIEALKTNERVRMVVFRLSSPGGEVGGVQNAARAIYSLRENGKKTIAYVDSDACSGAYWLAAACEEIVLSSETAEVGSVGVVVAHREISGLEQRIGVKTTEITSGEKKRVFSMYEPLSDAGRSELEERVKEIHGVFRADTSRMRPQLSPESIGVWGEGKVFIGARAVEAGLADRIEYIPDLFSIGEKDVDLNKLKADFPQVYAQAVDVGRGEAKAEAAKAIEAARVEGLSGERARVCAILDVSMPGYESAKAKAVRDGSTVEAFAVSVVQGKAERDQEPKGQAISEDDKKKIVLEAMRGEAPKVGAQPEFGKIKVDGHEMTEAEFQASLDAAVKAADNA